MNREDNLLAELQRLASLPEMHGSLDTHLNELTSAAARLLRARSCTFLWLSEEHPTPDADAALSTLSAQHGIGGEVVFERVTIDAQSTLQRDTPDAVAIRALQTRDDPSGDVLRSPIRRSGHVIGMVHVSGPMDKPRFDLDDLRMLHIVTVYIGKSLHAAQLHNLLQSRFAQIALVQSVGDTVGQVLAAVPHPAQIVKILAKSFYREMTKAGFGTNEIINAASQIISELSASLKRHARRRDASLVEPSAGGKAQDALRAAIPAAGRPALSGAAAK